jgi:hypothetical protein
MQQNASWDLQDTVIQRWAIRPMGCVTCTCRSQCSLATRNRAGSCNGGNAIGSIAVSRGLPWLQARGRLLPLLGWRVAKVNTA